MKEFNGFGKNFAFGKNSQSPMRSGLQMRLRTVYKNIKE